MARARTSIYYRIRTTFLEENAALSASAPFSTKENGKFRPDLPMRFFRHQNADWSDNSMDLIALEGNFSIPTKQLMIIPFGTKGGTTKPVKVEAADDKSLSLQAIIEAACAAQQVRCSDVKGVGLYRSGLVGGIPSYYIWGAVDRAGHAD